jgi:hypothetical protein
MPPGLVCPFFEFESEPQDFITQMVLSWSLFRRPTVADSSFDLWPSVAATLGRPGVSPVSRSSALLTSAGIKPSATPGRSSQLETNPLQQFAAWKVFNANETSWPTISNRMVTIATRGTEAVTGFFLGEPSACRTALKPRAKFIVVCEIRR